MADIRVKICGLRSPADVAAVAAAGAAYAGFVFFAKSPRNVTPQVARELALAAPPGLAKVGLVVDADDATLDELEGDGRVAFRYLENCNGSRRNIAGVLNAAGNVLGMMPHPERAIEPAHGGTDGRALFEGAIRALARA